MIENGFYYDFFRNEPFTPEDFPAIEKKMREIIARDAAFTKEIWSRDQAKAWFETHGEAFKVELVDAIPADQDLKIYKQGEWLDLCRGPHMTSTGKIGSAFRLMKVAGAYWRGDSTKPMLSRIYGTAFARQDELDAYLKMLEEAEKRDHRRLGREMDLFHFQEEGPGTVFWHPKGWTLFQTLIAYMRRRQNEAGYIEVNTPQVLDRALWETSGHWQTYRENMFITQTEDERVFALKPMNCPGHIQIFKNGLKSYRDLPMKISEFGIVHRYEPSGALHGVIRVRAFTQDDAHIFCTEDQIMDEAMKVNDLIMSIYADFGFDDIVVKLSTRPDKRVGADEVWDKAERALARVLEKVGETGIKTAINPGEGAFYGPKLEYTLARRDRPRMAMRHDAGRLQYAGPLRRLLYRPRQREEDAGDDPSRDLRLARTVHRHSHRASCRASAALARAVADRRRDDHPGGRRLCARTDRARPQTRAARRRRSAQREDHLQGARTFARQGAGAARRRQARGGRTDRLDAPARFAAAAGDDDGGGHRQPRGRSHAARRAARLSGRGRHFVLGGLRLEPSATIQFRTAGIAWVAAPGIGWPSHVEVIRLGYVELRGESRITRVFEAEEHEDEEVRRGMTGLACLPGRFLKEFAPARGPRGLGVKLTPHQIRLFSPSGSVVRPFGVAAREPFMTYTVLVGYDEEHARYFILDSSIPGLNVEADSFEELVEITKDVAHDLVGEKASGAKIDFHREVELAN